MRRKSFCLSADGEEQGVREREPGQLPKVIFTRSKEAETGIKVDIMIGYRAGIISYQRRLSDVHED
jgi:hypothetical protein